MPVPGSSRLARPSACLPSSNISGLLRRPSLIRLRPGPFGAPAYVLATLWPPSTASPALTLTGPTPGPQ
jgi:hypothetical protein